MSKINRILAFEATKMFLRSLRVRFMGFEKKGVSVEGICNNSIKKCFNGRYFTASTGHFNVFYLRDFGISVENLLKLGYKKEVFKTLNYCLNVFEKNQKISVAISNFDEPYDFPTISPDGLPLLIHSLRLTNMKSLVLKHKIFLEKEIHKYFREFIDIKTGLIVDTFYFSSMKDHSLRKSSCYDNCMVGMMKEDLERLDLVNPFSKYHYKKLIKDNFWNGRFFFDDLTKQDYVAGDAQIFPFWTGLFNDEKVLRRCVKSIQEEGLDKPFPLKYTRDYFSPKMREYFGAIDYEKDNIWTNIGVLYLDLVRRIDPVLFGSYLGFYDSRILRYKTFLEVYNRDGNVYSTPFYYSDEGMLWCANYLALKKY